MKNIILAIFLLCFTDIFAQYPDWKYYSVAGSVNAIAQDENFIWTGSHAGAMKLDINTGMRTFYDKTNAPMTDSWVSEIAIGNDGTKWFGTWDKGYLIKYDDLNWTVFDPSNSPLSGSPIKGLATDNDNSVWIASGCLINFDGTEWIVYNTSNSGLPSNYINDLICDGNTIWMGTNVGLTKFDGMEWTSYNTSNSNISDDPIIGIDIDNNGIVWILHYNGVEKFDGDSFSVFNDSNTNIPNTSNYSITIDENNIIWTGCISYNFYPVIPGGIMSFDGSTWTKYDTSNSGIASNDVSPVFADNSNNIWYGSGDPLKLGRKNGSVWATFDPSNSCLGNGYIRQIVHDQNGTTFIGTQYAGPANSLFRYDWNSWTGLPNYTSSSLGIAADRSGNLYVKNPTGIKKYDGTNWSDIPGTPLLHTNYQVPLYLNTINADLPGELWMDYLDRIESFFDTIYGNWYYYAHEGLAHYDGNEWETFSNLNTPVPDAEIYDIRTEASNQVWFGTNCGLIRYDGTDWTVYDTSNSTIPTNHIKSFVVDSLGNIWLSNGHHGLYRFDLVDTINYPHPTLNQYVSSFMLELDPDGSIWQASLFKLIHFDGINWTTFDTDNSPIPNFSNLTSLSIDENGNAWIGTQFGFLIYNQGGVITSTEPEQHKESLISVYPNPFNDAFEMDFGKPLNDVNITVFDLLGRKVFSTVLVQASRIRIPRNKMSPGIYSYQVKSGEKVVSGGKIIAD